MKPDDVMRSVRSAKNDRATGDAPLMGKVARMPGTGLPKGVRRKKLRSEGGRSSRLRESRRLVITIWSFLLAGAVLVVLGLFIGLWLVPQMTKKEDGAVAESPVEAEKKAKVASVFPSPSESEALALVSQALAVRDEEKVTDHFRLGSATPQMVVDFLKNLEATDGPLVSKRWLSSMDANGLSLDGVLATFKGSDRQRNRLALLTPDVQGIWKLDFDALARTVSPAWKDLLGGAASTGTIRIYAAKDSYYNGPFRDEKRWTCYSMGSSEIDQNLLGYCEIGSPQAAAMISICSQGRRISRAVLEIRRVEGAEPRQFEISRVLAEDWAMGPVPFDQGFR